GASCIYAGSWLEGAGAVFAENEALRWLADVAGLPPEAGGVFVSGGSAGNLAGLVAARHTWRRSDERFERVRGMVVSGPGAHSSIASAARVMDADVMAAGGDERDRLTGTTLSATLDSLDPHDAARTFAVVATAGTTNAGIIDDLDGVGRVCEDRGLWLHVDGAYGGGAMVAPSARPKFRGIEQADSLVIDPHKWLFAPFDCAAVLYRDPALARTAHTQHAEYLDVLAEGHEWNPSDFAYHLTRRARGLPFWFSLASHGTRNYEEAVEQTLVVAREAAGLVEDCPHTELLAEPELSVVLFRRIGWSAEQYQAWSDRVLAEGLTLTVPTAWKGETCLRFCFVNPRTSANDVQLILDSLA
ncbi:MAG TPA: pyridoxal-dependent decarboxylase, partial [Acidimicrobiales bacterium]